MKFTTLLAAACCLTSAVTAQEKGPFTISINRPVKAGDKYAIRSLAQTTTSSSAAAGSEAGVNLQRQALLLEGNMEIQAVTPKESQPWKYRIQVTKCTAGEKEGAEALVPAGTEITMELTKERAPLLKVGGKAPAEPLLSLLKFALPTPAVEDVRPEDQMFGHADKKAEDDEWTPNTAIVAAAFKKKGFTGAESAFTNSANLVEVTDWDNVPCILVKGKVAIKPCTIALAGAKPASAEGSLTFSSEYYLPLDAGLPLLREKTETRQSFEAKAAAGTVKTEQVTWVTRTLKKK